MQPVKLSLWALLVMGLTVNPAAAAWNNVFQPTCLFKNRQTTSNYVVPPATVAYAAPVAATLTCNSCAQKQCTTNYTQRCFYQPVTTYESRSYYEPVTTMQTSYYYEPVTSYRYSCYYDPCSCSYQQVATPVTSYSLKAQSCPVQSWVQRCAQVPVTSYQKSCYLEPQTTCCTTTTGAMIPMSASAQVQVQAPAPAPAPTFSAVPPAPQAPNPPPVIDQQRTPPPGPSVGTSYYYHQTNGAQAQPAQSNWQPTQGTVPVAPQRIAQAPADTVQGQVTRNDQSPRTATQIVFVNAATGARQTAMTNEAGRFTAPLSSGTYYVYLASRERSATYHSQVQVAPNQPNILTFVN